MPVYQYKAIDPRGKTRSGMVDAEGVQAARQKVREQGLFPVDIAATGNGGDSRKAADRSSRRSRVRIAQKDRTLLIRQLATLIGAGFPLVAALNSVLAHARSQPEKKLIAIIKDRVESGTSFAGALSDHPSVFPPLYVQMVRVGETAGTLDAILTRLADMGEHQLDLQRRIRAAMIYPILMITVSLAVLVFLFTNVMPNILSIFADLNQQLPAPTRVLMAIGDFIRQYGWGVLLFIATAGCCLIMARQTDRGGRVMDRMILATPGIGTVAIKLIASRVARMLAALLEAGVNLVPALGIVAGVAGNRGVADAIRKSQNAVERGENLADALAPSKMMPPIMIEMIHIGEQASTLDGMLLKAAEIFERDGESAILQFTRILEPAMILVMASVVGFIVISVILPILEMNTLIQ